MAEKYELNTQTYEWTVRMFERIRKLLGINIKVYGDQSLLTQGEIFLFNHFARTETFLPHYIIYKETGAFCRCIATKELFHGNEAFRNYLIKVGVVPNDHDELLPLLVADIIRGRKVVIFPEGGMVKSRRVLDDKGRHRVYSRKAESFRKHHTGAAVLALAVDAFKLAVLSAEKIKDWQRVDEWVDMLELKNRQHLLFAAHKPTKIIPGNITFYPINTDENVLFQGINLFNKLSPRAHEELLIETNLLLKDTDMDMRLDRPIELNESYNWWERKLMTYLANHLRQIDDFFSLKMIRPWLKKIIQRNIKRSSEKLRDKYMDGIYLGVTINLNHIASTIIMYLINNEQNEISIHQFYRSVYLAVKYIQQESEIHLHRSLRNPESYSHLSKGDDTALKQFIDISIKAELLAQNDTHFFLKDKLQGDFEFDAIRLENTVRVYANEVAPVSPAIKAIEQAILDYETIDDRDFSYYQHDDELRSYDWDHHYYSKPRFDEINRVESAIECGRPFFYLPEHQTQRLGIVLTHGFLASPAEIKPLSDKLQAKGYPVYGVRLPGHGTSPVDLRERSWEEWLQAVKRGYEILSPHVDEICLIGFSTGAVLSLHYAAENLPKLAGTIAINPPIKFRNKNMKFVPLIQGVSRIVRWASSLEGVMPYRKNDPEHPRINYRNMPLRGLYELKQLKTALDEKLAQITCPCLILQSSNDPVVATNSAELLLKGLVNSDVSFIQIESDRHGILYENIGNTHQFILDYLERLLTSQDKKNTSTEEKSLQAS